MGNQLKNNVNICCQPRDYIIEGNIPNIELIKPNALINSDTSEINSY